MAILHYLTLLVNTWFIQNVVLSSMNREIDLLFRGDSIRFYSMERKRDESAPTA